MKILVACEFSGAVRDAFRCWGHEAWSCDLEGVEPEGQYKNYHLFGDCRYFLDREWDLMIAHPPCTYLANSGVRWLKDNSERQAKRELAIMFVKQLWESPINKIAIENPIGCLSTRWMKPTQIIQPFQFGHPEFKSTCLWLKNLPSLKPSSIVEPERKLCGGKKPGRVSSRLHRLPPSKDRAKIRSRTFIGIAKAMAEQWN
jgi:hypothetical protein